MRARVLAVFLVALGPAAAAPQEAAPALPEDPRAPRFREVERGFFAGLEAGWLGLAHTPTADRTRFPAAGAGGGHASGPVVALQLGVDLGERVAVSVMALAAAEQARVNYGAFGLLGGGAEVRVALAGWPDSQGVRRLHLQMRARGALVTSEPLGLFQRNEVLIAAGPGLEYFTRLRHFSVGVGVDGVWALRAKAPGIAVVPVLRYTF
ncbi:MAG TPA: adventurous gliding motility protein CglE [Anaeromyxobacteraceae bacterium]|jgi:hypothetical protein